VDLLCLAAVSTLGFDAVWLGVLIALVVLQLSLWLPSFMK